AARGAARVDPEVPLHRGGGRGAVRAAVADQRGRADAAGLAGLDLREVDALGAGVELARVRALPLEDRQGPDHLDVGAGALHGGVEADARRAASRLDALERVERGDRRAREDPIAGAV